MRRFCLLLSAFLVVTAQFPAAGRAASPESCPPAERPTGPAQVFTGAFGQEQEGGYVLVPFEVAEGSTRVEVRLCYDQPESPTNRQIKHTLDLGIYDATNDGFYDHNEFRGWGGSSRPRVRITPERATVGFLPGAIPPGTWAAEIGVASVAGQLEGDMDGGVAWRLEVYVGSDPSDLDAPWQPTPYDSTPARAEAGWYKGDFHVHAEHSSPNDASMRETFDYAFGPAKLDFVTLSDYVTTRHWHEIGRFQPDYPGKLVVRSAEVITYRGHTNNHASATYVDYRTGPIYVRQGDGSLTRVRGAEPASRIFDEVHAAGGFTQVNHPTIFPSEIPGFAGMCRGCPWDYSDAETQWEKVDAYEVQTGPAGAPDPQGHEPGPNPFTPSAIAEWDDLYNRGFHITAVGSSDSHHAGSPNGPTQSPIGEATTVVYARELSETGIKEAIEAGHAYVKFFSPQGPDLRFTATALEGPGGGRGRGRPTAMMGDTLPVGAARFSAQVLDGGPSPEPRVLLVYKDGKPHLGWVVDDHDFEVTFEADKAGHYRLQLYRGSAIEALSNPITLRPKS